MIGALYFTAVLNAPFLKSPISSPLPVSYTHLDVYKRQALVLAGAAGRTACMFFAVMVMIVVGTYSVRIVIQSSVEIGFYIGIRIALASAEVTDSYAGQRILSAAADASADEKFYALLAKEHCKRFMTEITGIEDLCPDDFIVLYVVKLKLCLLYTSRCV